MIKIGVTGCAGYIGSRLTHHLLQRRDVQVMGVDCLRYGGDALLPLLHRIGNFTFNDCSLYSSEQVWSHLESCQIIFHAAFLVGEPACSANPLIARQLNLDPLEIWQRFVGDRRYEALNVNFSTCSVYGATTYAVEESWHPQAKGVYAEHKIAVEKILAGHLNLRLGTLFGVSPRMRFDLMINEAVRQLTIGNDEPEHVAANPFFRHPLQCRPYLRMEDLLSLCDRLIAHRWDELRGKTYNVVTTNLRQTDIHELLDEKLSIAPVSAEPLLGYRCSGRAITEELGFETSAEDMLLTIERLEQAVRTMYDPWSKQWQNA